jgi:hypothetical protein
MISFRSKQFFGLAALITLGGLALRSTSLGGSLEYDEIWTLEFYASKSLKTIFTDLGLPNNHPLNSLLVKLTVIGENSVSIRLSAWLAGVLAIPAAGYLAWLISRRRRAALWTMAVIALSAPLAAYSQLARGYSLQLFLLLVFGIGALWLWRGKQRIGAYFAIATGAIGSMLTLSTSILTLLPAGAVLAVALIRRKRYRDLVAGIAPGLFALLWYSLNFKAFRAGQVWGVEFSSAADYFRWLLSVANQLGVYPLAFLAVLIAGYWCCRRYVFALGISSLFPLLAALLTRGGPPRAYFVLIAIWALLAGAAAAMPRLAKRRFFTVLFALLLSLSYSVNLQNWRSTDYYALFDAVKAEPPQRLVVLPATESKPFAWNNRPDAYKEFINRLLIQAPERELMMLQSPGGLNGTDRNGAEVVLKLPLVGDYVRVGNAVGELYRLREIRTVPKAGDTVIAVIRPVPEAAMAAITRQFKVYPWIKLNFFLTVSFSPKGVPPHHYALLAVRVDDPSLLGWEKLLADTRGAVSFYRVMQ